ncbi:MAG TPA: hypothetical protein VGO11_26620 [Chthoniobacteraceae bacterium]|nr:hypothetical protein [Chthoniobacteraceae bacterium]
MLVLLLLSQICSAKTKRTSKPKPRGTLQFIYYVEDPDGRLAREAARIHNYTALRAWLDDPAHAPAAWQKEVRVDLNGDGRPEVFLLIYEHGHFADYSMFTQVRGQWRYIGGASYGGEAPARLARARGRWHDFSLDITGSRNRLVRHYYQWDPGAQEYEESYEITIRPMERMGDEP